MVRDQDHGAFLDRDSDPLRNRLRHLLPRLHVLPALNGQLDQWAEWLVRTRFAGWSDEEVRASLDELGRKRDRVLDRAEIQRGEAVVDVGAGIGLLALGAVDRVGPDGDVLAIDISVDALEELRAHATAPNLFYYVGSAEVLPLTNEAVDVVLTRSVLIYVKEKAEAAREFYRVLEHGGRASLFEPINSRNLLLSDAVDFSPLGDLGERLAAWNKAFYANRDDPMIDFDERDLDRFFREAGFVDVRLDQGVDEQEIAGTQYLNQVGAPGRPTLLQRWREAFDPQDVERLAEFLEERTIPARFPHVFLTARKE